MRYENMAGQEVSEGNPSYLGTPILPPVWKLQMIRDVNMPSATQRLQIMGPGDVATPLLAYISQEPQEHFVVVLLDTKNGVIGMNTVSVGSVAAVVIRAAEVFRPALLLNASTIIIAHNHPSGDPSPSPDDIRITEILVEAGKLLEIPVLDHIVVGDGKYISMKERGLGFGRR